MSVIYINSYQFAVAAPPADLLLDTYTGAAAAYSLRQLRTGVTSVVRVRRSSDNTEQDFTADQITDGTLTAFCGAGNGFIRTWYDQSGNNINVEQSTAIKQPRIVSSGSLETEGTRPSIRFDGLDDFLQVLNTDFATSLGLSIYTTSNISTGRIIDKYSGSPVRRFWTVMSTSSILEDAHTGGYNSNSLASHSPSTGFLLRSFAWNKDNFLQAYTNSSITGTATALQANYSFTAGLASPVGIGADLDGAFNFANGTISEVIVFGARHVSERTAIEANINAHYGIF